MPETNPSPRPAQPQSARREHWDSVYETKSDTQLSWLQESPDTSLSLIDAIQPQPRRVIDIGGGQSLLAARLLERGVAEVVVLDVSAAALERAKARLGETARLVQWIVADVTSEWDTAPVDLWHDRAVFHFLTNPADRLAYATRAAAVVRPGGTLIVATFAPTGPEKCSGLTVCRYDAATLAREFGAAFRFTSTTTETHFTPWGKPQDFIFVVLRRVGV